MRPLKTFFAEPNLPPKLSILRELVFNLRWTWNAESRELFRRIDPDLWHQGHSNPVKMLGDVDAARYLALEQDESFTYQLGQVQADYEEYMKGESTWFSRSHPELKGPIIGYFSAEFGIADCVPIFSGGLGVLAGDHLKSASDMGVPIIGVGLAYQNGYFRQYLNPEGWQQETYPVNDFHIMPMTRVQDGNERQVVVDIPFPGRIVKANVWKVQVGRSPLYLLDTNHPDNSAYDRRITAELYGGDQETRIQQEIVLGMGGVKMLELLGIDPPVLHTNEGHAAFLTLERVRQFMRKYNVSFNTAREATISSVIFTTHTPVPAGIDVFPKHLVERYFADYVADVGITMDDLLKLGRFTPIDPSEGFNMAILAVRLSYAANGVSKLHRKTSRKMWRNLWSGVPENDIPIGSITNGIHIPSWISNEMGSLLDRYLGPKWREDPRDRVNWERVDRIPLEELWRTHERRRERLVAFARTSNREQNIRQGAGISKIERATEVLDPEALTIGFARRFAPYKRATLLFRDMDRLIRLVSDKGRPVQFIFAGKAHPKDHFGKELISKIVLASRRPELARSIVFIEDYDMHIARYMVQGVDVWMNTPRRPKEASGTSGMKAVANGAIHCSTKDGWWAEVNSEGIGWTIGGGEEYTEEQQDYQDEIESRALYDLLENELVPLFYKRGADNIPARWIQMMKRSMKELCPVFNSNRMVRQYSELYYIPALRHFERLSENSLSDAMKLAEWKKFVSENWDKVRLVKFEADIGEEIMVGSTGEVRAWLDIAPLLPQDLSVEIVHGRIGPDFQIVEAGAVPMHFDSTQENNVSLFKGVVPCIRSGKFGVAIRVLPKHRDLASPYQTGLIKTFES